MAFVLNDDHGRSLGAELVFHGQQLIRRPSEGKAGGLLGKLERIRMRLKLRLDFVNFLQHLLIGCLLLLLGDGL